MSADREYTARLRAESDRGWKRVLDVQAPYRGHIRRVVEGRVLDVGCGIGRNLHHLDGNGVGVDLNPHSVEVAREAGLTAHTTDEFEGSVDAVPGGYDTMLLAHVLEHMTLAQASDMVGGYLLYLRPGGRVVMIVPQEAGFASDPTHVDFVGLEEIAAIEKRHGLGREKAYSFPFPRPVGRFFRYNETVVLSRKV